MMRRIVLMSAFVVLVASACSDSAETSADSSTSTTAGPTTTTQPATTTTATPTTTTEPATTTTAAPTTTVPATMELTSTAFENEEAIPVRYTCDGDDISPALTLAEVPAGAESLVLIMEDPDAPNGTWDHWIAYNIPVVAEITEDVGELGTAGTNSWGLTGYGGPCPPSGTHRYFFTVFALDTNLGLDEGAAKDEVLAALGGNILAEGILMGTYSR